jgi:hypothetical protein
MQDPRDSEDLTHTLRQLGEISDRAKYARVALLDEHEGNFRHHVEQLAGLADQLLELVRTF